jgi:soluble lytic murein transglycosylase-like protein
VAVAIVAAATGFPRVLGELNPLQLQAWLLPGAATVPRVEHGAFLGRVESLLAERMPELDELDRVRLADAIVEEARLGALDPLFVLAVIAVESGFDAEAESEHGARGIMQLKPSTLRQEAERSQLQVSDPEDPVVNVRAGVRYYLRLLRAFGNHDAALMAYNAGPNRILKLLQGDEPIPERFRAYARRVQAEFQRLKGNRGPELALAGGAAKARSGSGARLGPLRPAAEAAGDLAGATGEAGPEAPEANGR